MSGNNNDTVNTTAANADEQPSPRVLQNTTLRQRPRLQSCHRHTTDSRRRRLNDSTFIPLSFSDQDSHNGYHPLLHLFLVTIDPDLRPDPANDRRTLRFLSRLLTIAEDDSGLSAILHATNVDQACLI